MSLFHLSVHLDSRSKTDKNKKSCVRKIAYNCRADFEKIANVENANFTHKNDFVESFLMMPVHTKSAFAHYAKTVEKDIYEELKEIAQKKKNKTNTYADDQRFEHLKACVFAKSIDRVEKRCDAQLTREVIVSLQHELTLAENKEILKRFVEEAFISQGMMANVAIHADLSSLNSKIHAHISLSTRDVSDIATINQNQQLFSKKNREWNKLENVELWRKKWADINNEYLKKYDYEQITHLSYERQAKQALKENDFREYERLQKLAKNVLPHIPRVEMRTRSQKQAYQEKRKHHKNIINTINNTFMELYVNAHRFIKNFTAKIHSNANKRNRLRNRDLLRNQLTNTTRINEERKDVRNAMQREPDSSSIFALSRT
ncbi:TPA: MobA/MobL family protein [Pasteurella multocida]|nr:MobA/MobL family protein [Pasteurella multocida]